MFTYIWKNVNFHNIEVIQSDNSALFFKIILLRWHRASSFLDQTSMDTLQPLLSRFYYILLGIQMRVHWKRGLGYRFRIFHIYFMLNEMRHYWRPYRYVPWIDIPNFPWVKPTVWYHKQNFEELLNSLKIVSFNTFEDFFFEKYINLTLNCV